MLRKRVALVTDGTSELAEAIAVTLCRRGFHTVVAYPSAFKRPPEWVAARRSEGAELSSVSADPASYPSCEAAARSIYEHLGRIDALINNVDVVREAPIGQMSFEDWRAVLKDNIDAAFNMAKQTVSNMAESRWGRVVNISSIHAQQGALAKTAYAAAKAAVHGFTKALAVEVAARGVTVNTVSPGRLESLRGAAPAVAGMTAMDLPPVGRLGKPAEVAALIAYLCSEEAAFITGAEIAINGGEHMC